MKYDNAFTLYYFMTGSDRNDRVGRQIWGNLSAGGVTKYY